MSSYRVLLGDVQETLSQLDERSVQYVVTSPPYWNLRDYQIEPVEFPEVAYSPMPGIPELTIPAWSGQLGAEPTPEMFVSHIVAVFRKVWRVLKDDGVCWVNFGDSYAASGKSGGGDQGKRWKESGAKAEGPRGGAWSGPPPGLKQKDLVGIPWRVAFALQADGWYLRSDIVWHKTNPMPSSVADRPTTAHEYLFLISKSKSYYYDADAIRTKAKSATRKMPDGWDTGKGAHGSFHRNGREKGKKVRGHIREHNGFNHRWDGLSKDEQMQGGANKRTVWPVATSPFPGAHFATYPPKLIEPCILAGSRPGDTVLDPFGGSGTTAAVALEHGRDAVLCELNPEYVDLIPDRIDSITDALVQGRLFEGVG